MLHFDYVLLYVRDPLASESFYADLLGVKAVESAPTFVLFVLPNGAKLGLWLRDEIQPAPAAAPGAMELGLSLPDEAAVHDTHRQWAARGITIAQAPVRLDFGLTFLALDPDGHRIRAFTPAE